MTNKVIVNKKSMEDIANSIRSNLNTTATYKPSEMPAAISTIPLGRNMSQNLIDKALVEGTLQGYYKNEYIEKLRAYAFYKMEGLISVDLPNLLYGDTGDDNNFSDQEFGQYLFGYCVNLEEVNLPKLKIVSTKMFYKCEKLTKLDLPAVEEIYNGAFSYTNLTTLILRYDGLVQILNTGDYAFSNCPLTDGYIYVPAARLAEYEADYTWNMYKHAGYAGFNFRAIEDYPEICG